MIDPITNKPVKVSEGGAFGPSIRLPADQLEKVMKLLHEHGVRHWADHYIMSFNGRPPVAFINIRAGHDRDFVQALLDAAT